MKLATAAQMKQLDRRAIEEEGIASLDLMERAAEGIVQAALRLLPGQKAPEKAAVICGVGNNGGDGIAAAQLLFLQGIRVRVFLVGSCEKMTEDALVMKSRLGEYGVDLEVFEAKDLSQAAWIRQADVVIDALFGVGLSREIGNDSVFAAAIARMNESEGKIVSADIPSGVEADTGRVLGCAVKADVTVTFTCGKIGLATGEGAVLSGEVMVHEIGIPEALKSAMTCTAYSVEVDFFRQALPKRKADGHKGDFGKVMVVGGSVGYTGAPYLAASAAVHSGCGLVYLGVPESIWLVEATKCVSAMPFPLPEEGGMLCPRALPMILERFNSCHVLALGPGLGRSAAAAELVCRLLEEIEKPVVLDADGINALDGHMDVLKRRQGRVTILTPHEGEFTRIGGAIDGDRVGAARRFARDYGCILVLKGHRTVTAEPGGVVWVNTTGNSGLAKGGSGDVLTGMIASLLAQGTAPVRAAAGGVWLHGRCGDIAAQKLTAYAMTPQDVISALPQAFSEFI